VNVLWLLFATKADKNWYFRGRSEESIFEGGVIMRLKDKVAIVTGGSQGIGEAISYAYAREGASVAVVNYRKPEQGQAVAKQIEDGGGTAKAFICDVSKRNECEALVKNVVDAFGTVDILAAVAGIMINKPIEEYAEEEWDAMIDVNLKGTFLMCQAVVPLMKEKRYGKIILTGSIAATRAFPNAVPYCASKGGVLMITKSLALEIARFGINVNCISPGNTATPLNKHLQDNPEFVKYLEERTPTGRAYLSVEEVAGAAVFLASEEASAFHGTELVMDDGWNA
jgi:NAD(P)-dependent dehydrogenase (short-subunit alcohol dehydrogenase family)